MTMPSRKGDIDVSDNLLGVRGRVAKEKDLGKKGLNVRNDQVAGCAVDSEWYNVCGGPGLLDGCSVAPWDGGKRDCSGTSAYGSESCSNVSTELLAGAQCGEVIGWKL